jgi:hypothetical protein
LKVGTLKDPTSKAKLSLIAAAITLTFEPMGSFRSTQCIYSRRTMVPGFWWYKDPETAAKIKSGEINHWAMSPEGYYFRTAPVFEAPGRGKHDWLNKTIMVGCGARVENGNVIRYYKVV